MFSFQTDDDLPNTIITITFVMTLLLSFIHLPEGTITRPLELSREIITNLIYRCLGIEGPAPHPHPIHNSGHGRGHELRGPTTEPVHMPDPTNTATEVSRTICNIIGQEVPANRTIPLISAVDNITTRIINQNLFKLNINDNVHPNEEDETQYPNTHLRTTNSIRQTYLINLELVPDDGLDNNQRLARVLKHEVLITLASSLPPASNSVHDTLANSLQYALGGIRSFPAETTQRTIVQYLQQVRRWFVGFVPQDRGQGGAGRDIEMDQVPPQANDEESGVVVTSWVKEMASEVVKEMRLACELMPPEAQEEVVLQARAGESS